MSPSDHEEGIYKQDITGDIITWGGRAVAGVLFTQALLIKNWTSGKAKHMD